MALLVRQRFLWMLVIGLSVAMAASAEERLILWDPPFAVKFVEGEEELAQRAMDALQGGLAELEGRLHAGDEPIRVALCDTLFDFRRFAGPLAVPEVGGIARPAEGLIAVKAPHLLRRPGEFDAILRHELVHVLLERNTDTTRLPKWLNEGLAMTLAREHRWNSMWIVAQMYARGQIIPYRDLEFALAAPGSETGFSSAYAQSLSMTRHLLGVVGEEVVWQIVEDLNEMSFGDALRKRAGFGPVEFFESWTRSLWKVAFVSSLVSGFGVFQFMAILAVLGYVRKQRQGAAIMRRWDAEDDEAYGDDEPDAYEEGDEDDDDAWFDGEEEEWF